MENAFSKKIHGIRGFAILYVLLFHFFPEFFPGGFMGVDVFFVLSGYLVAQSSLKKDYGGSSTFFLKTFYMNRIARIVPMALVASILGLFLSMSFTNSPSELRSIYSFFVSSIFGYTNFNLIATNANYFATSQESNFFTHFWSLGIEEQFYFLFSGFFALGIILSTRNRGRFKTVFLYLMFAAFFVSLMYSIFAHINKADETVQFYSLASRWWEMGAGVIFGLLTLQKPKDPSLAPALWRPIENIALIFLIACLFLSYQGKYFPMPLALGPVCLTLFFLHMSSKQTASISERLLHLKPLQWLGTVSYSLYLVHWIVLVAIRFTFGLDSIGKKILGFLISIVMAKIAYSLVERPFNLILRKEAKRGFFLFGILSCIGIALISLMSTKDFDFRRLKVIDPFSLNISSWVDEVDCHGKRDDLKLESYIEKCLTPLRSVEKPRTFFISGDSHGVQLSFMAKKALEGSDYTVRYINTETGADAYGFTRGATEERPQVLEFILDQAVPGDIVLITFSYPRLVEFSPEHETFQKGKRILDAYFSDFEKKGVSVILVGDSPWFTKDRIHSCAFNYLVRGDIEACVTSLDRVEPNRANQIYLFKNLSLTHKNVHFWDLLPYFCDEKQCFMASEKQVWFFDHHHLSKEGSERLSPKFKLFVSHNFPDLFRTL